MFSIGFILYNGPEAEINNFDENRRTTTSMHGSEENDDKFEIPEENFSLEDILEEIKEDWEENNVLFTNPTKATR